MKNVFLGIVGFSFLLYITVLQIGMTQIYARENEINNCLAQVLQSTLEKNYYISGELNQDIGVVFHPEEMKNYRTENEIIQQIKTDILLRLGSDSSRRIDVLVCDMEMGILSVKVQEGFSLPLGKKVVVEGHKTIVIEHIGKKP